MAMATISIEVDANAAQALDELKPADRRKLLALLDLRLRELTSGPIRPLKIIMDEIGATATTRGLTPEILDSLLHE